MRITEAEKLEAYQLAMHQLIGTMANLQAWVRLAKRGDVNLMDPEVLANLDEMVHGRNTTEAMDPVATYQRRMIEERRRQREAEGTWEGPHGETYWLGISGTPEDEMERVTQEKFVRAEQACGFRPKPGCGPVATGGFSTQSTKGSIRYPTTTTRKPSGFGKEPQ